MKSWKLFCYKLLFPPMGIIIFLSLICGTILVYIFTNELENSPLAYAGYVISFYTLTIVCIAGYKKIPGFYKSLTEKMYSNQYTNRYLTDTVFKTHVTLQRSLIINLIYIIINAVSAIIYKTHWFSIFAIYYFILAVIRFLLIRYEGHYAIGSDLISELKRSRLCSYILMTVNLALTGVVLMMLYANKGFEYQGVLIYVVALYTFYATTISIIDIIKYRKYRSPIMTTSKIVNLAAALVSMLFLETAMFSQFGSNTPQKTQNLMIMLTGGGISIVVVTMSVYNIVHSSKEIKNLKRSSQ